MAMKPVWALVLLLPCVLLGQERAAPTAVLPSVTVSLPDSVKPEGGRIQYEFRSGTGAYGDGLQTHAGVYDYPVSPEASEIGQPDSLKLFVYIPGYRAVTRTFSREDLRVGKVFIPQLIPLPTTTMRGRLIDSAGNPLKEESLRLKLTLDAMMGYYGYTDGVVGVMQIADTRTDRNGNFSITVPSLLDDPFFADAATPGMFGLFSDTATPGMLRLNTRKEIRDRDSTLVPDRLHLQKSYEPLTIQKIRNGKLTGRLGNEFLRRINLSRSPAITIEVGPPESVYRPIPTITAEELRKPRRWAATVATPSVDSFSDLVKADGTFELSVPPGTYAVYVRGRVGDESSVYQQLSVEQNVAIEEGKQRILDPRVERYRLVPVSIDVTALKTYAIQVWTRWGTGSYGKVMRPDASGVVQVLMEQGVEHELWAFPAPGIGTRMTMPWTKGIPPNGLVAPNGPMTLKLTDEGVSEID